MSLYMLDTDICIEIMRGRSRAIMPKFRRLKFEEVAISTITMAELEVGVARSDRPLRNRIALADFCAMLAILPFDESAAVCYGRVRHELEIAGKPIGAMDALIAAHAFSLDLTLVTNNTREFSRVMGLKIENWLDS